MSQFSAKCLAVRPVVLAMLFGAAVFAAQRAQAQTAVTEYKGLCEASAGAFLDDKHFVVASDETNVLQLYERGKPEPIGNGIDLTGFTSFDKSDLEASARIDDRVYWMSSHSFNSKGKDNTKRKVFFATKIGQADGKPTLTGVGKVAKALRDPLATATGVDKRVLNVEAMAATPQGGLLIGLRAPLRDALAIVVPLNNPAAVVDNEAAPDFGKVELLDLGGLGFRSMELVGNRYVILAGTVSDSSTAFVAYRWLGPGNSKVEKIEGLNQSGIRPEGAMAVPSSDLVQLISDDGEQCSDEDDPSDKRKFRSVDIKP